MRERHLLRLGSGSGSDQKGPDPAGSGSATLLSPDFINPILNVVKIGHTDQIRSLKERKIIFRKKYSFNIIKN
jgi:hypothetical protein